MSDRETAGEVMGSRNVDRRTIMKGAAWSVPVIAAAVSAPFAAATGCNPAAPGQASVEQSGAASAAGAPAIVAPVRFDWGWGQSADATDQNEGLPSTAYAESYVTQTFTVPANANKGSIVLHIGFSARPGNAKSGYLTPDLGTNATLVGYLHRQGVGLGTPMVNLYTRDANTLEPGTALIWQGQGDISGDVVYRDVTIDGTGMALEPGVTYVFDWKFRDWGGATPIPGTVNPVKYIANDDLFLNRFEVDYTYSTC